MDAQQKLKKMAEYITKTLPDIIGTEAQKHFEQSFRDEGFTDNSLEPWDEVQRRKPDSFWKRKGRKRNPYKGKRRTKAILSDSESGGLGDSLTFDTNQNQVEITSDKEYAEAHNEGTNNAGRNRNTTIPKRQFAGESKKLIQRIENEIEKDFKRIENS